MIAWPGAAVHGRLSFRSGGQAMVPSQSQGFNMSLKPPLLVPVRPLSGGVGCGFIGWTYKIQGLRGQSCIGT